MKVELNDNHSLAHGRRYSMKDNPDNWDKEPVKADEKQVGGGHYKSMSIQPSEYIHRNNIGWYEGNAIKYISRHRQKGEKQDIEKAIHYLELLLQEYDEEESCKELKEIQ